MKLQRIHIIFIFSLFLGVIISMQVKSFSGINEIYTRDNNTGIFQEISILKLKNEDLRKEISVIEENLSQLSGQESAVQALKNELEKYKKLSGKFAIFGSGITLTLEGDISAPWMVDLINELFNIGAEAVDINGIRISGFISGIDSLPKGQIMINSSILTAPFVLNAIGESSVLYENINLSGGILDRIKMAFPGKNIVVEKKEIIKMN